MTQAHAVRWAVEDGALRTRLAEAVWAVHADRSVGSVAPLVPSGGGAAESAEPTEVDEALADAVALLAAPAVRVDVASATQDRGLIGAVVTDGRVGVSVARRIAVSPGGGPDGVRLRPGVEVSTFPVGALVGEVLRLVPAAPATVEAAPVLVPEELTVALAQAIRTGDRRTVDVLCAELGVAGVPPVLDAVVRTTDGNLTVGVGSAGSSTVVAGSWLRCDAGWVELARTPDGHVQHTPRTREDIAQAVLYQVTGALDAALTADRTPGEAA